MHPSYISLALFAIGAIGAPSYPRPESSDPFDTFPFMTGSSTVEEDDDMDDPLPAAMGAMMQAEQVEMASYSAPSVKPTHMAAAAAAAALGSDAPVAKPDVMEQPQVPQAEPSQVATPKPEPPMPAVEASPYAYLLLGSRS
ncbi:hypothetical protein N7468_001723 [Penicillium chermesinum]|uniref:Uncharacterized protein n=1 Tax=Penicillium chermesinum TaxID=63820 RepID=A0A9W9PH48_9EURO|nr:uncharacterized protein N7468_001723 [Penicillium chermesinum]KAJ5246740.1 hypothetical protein N7468_001723 [Penicillium chermesinum]